MKPSWVLTRIFITRPQWVALGEAMNSGRFRVGTGRQAFNRRKLLDVLVRNRRLDIFGSPTLNGRVAHVAIPPKVRSGRTGRNGSYVWARNCKRVRLRELGLYGSEKADD